MSREIARHREVPPAVTFSRLYSNALRDLANARRWLARGAQRAAADDFAGAVENFDAAQAVVGYGRLVADAAPEASGRLRHGAAWKRHAAWKRQAQAKLDDLRTRLQHAAADLEPNARWKVESMVPRRLNARRRKPPALAIGDTEIHTWFERDRAHVELRSKLNDETIVEWWDDDVGEAVEDGFLDPRDWHGSAYSYALDVGALREPRESWRSRVGLEERHTHAVRTRRRENPVDDSKRLKSAEFAIINGMARALFVSAEADREEEMGLSPRRRRRAFQAARELAQSYEAANDATLSQILGAAVIADGPRGSYDPEYASDLGYYLAMMALGHGVSWFDDHAEFPLKVPRFEFYL